MRIESTLKLDYELIRIDGKYYKRYNVDSWTFVFFGLQIKVNKKTTQKLEDAYQEYIYLQECWN